MLTYAIRELAIGAADKASDMYLVSAAKGGDHQAYAELCRRHSKHTLRTVLQITRNLADAEDTLQEALLKAYTHIGEFDGRSAFSSWLTRIAINSALMLLRKKRSRPVYSFETDPQGEDFKFPEPMETSHNPEESCIQNAMEKELAEAIRYLPPRLRLVMQIRYREDAPLAQIAKTLGISESAVKSRLFRAKSQIRMHLDKNHCLRWGIDATTLTGFLLLPAPSRSAPFEQRHSNGMGTAEHTDSSADVPLHQAPRQHLLLPRERTA
jgi:RNA polymerase sigma factor (sigma-70 family)